MQPNDFFLFLALLKKRYKFIILMAVIPAFLIGITIFMLPRYYKVNYSYEFKSVQVYSMKDLLIRNLIADISPKNKEKQVNTDMIDMNEKNWNKFLNRFYNQNILNLIKLKCKSKGFLNLSEKFNNLEQLKQFKKIVSFKTFPAYLKFNQWYNIKISDRLTPKHLNQISNLKLNTVEIEIIGTPKKAAKFLGDVIRKIFENKISLFILSDTLNNIKIEINSYLSDFDMTQNLIKLNITNNKRKLKKLLEIRNSEKNNPLPASPVIHFNSLKQNSTLLPIGYQVQELKSKLAREIENLKQNRDTYDYLNKISTAIIQINKSSNALSDEEQTLQSYRDIVISFIKAKKMDDTVKDYLRGYLRIIDAVHTVFQPQTDQPIIFSIPRYTIIITFIALIIFFIMSIIYLFFFDFLKSYNNN